ncbi:MAG: glycoside hydrolase family 32 protein [Saprospiraceae bacterium]
MGIHYILQFLAIYLLGVSATNPVNHNTVGDDEKYRPKYHFTPDSMWMNDPNGMVYYQGEYHLFYQYYPKANVWGPMHWGHAVSKDMITWEHLPIALFPDSHGYIFSGSAVIDWQNTSGFGSIDNPPMVAIFTYHDADKEKAGAIDFQTQGIAYSLDKGRTWKKYEQNPVISNPGFKDFRDPKVIWHDTTKRWIMVLAVKDKTMFYSSKDLKKWDFESEYGLKDDRRLWECPDLFPLKIEGSNEIKWVLVVSMQSGAPNGGTGTSYFIGDFDGHRFVNSQPENKQYWLDAGTDNYAMVSWSDIPAQDGRKLMLGWMSNWQYAQQVPTYRWRSAMTLPREVTLVNIAEKEWKLKSEIVREFESYKENKIAISKNNIVDDQLLILQKNPLVCELNISFNRKPLQGEFTILISSPEKDTLKIGFDPASNRYFIDRVKAGISDFNKAFPGKHFSPCLSQNTSLSMKIILDKSSVELFADEGLTAMTDIFFPIGDMNKIEVHAAGLSKILTNTVVYTLK